MSSATLHAPAANRPHHQSPNPLPQLIQTPSGLAILELQGTINLPPSPSSSQHDLVREADDDDDDDGQQQLIGRFEFPADRDGGGDNTLVHLLIGQHQRLTGEIRKLPRSIAVVRRRERRREGDEGDGGEQLEVAEVVKYKLLFSSRPEPVGTKNAV